MVKNKLGSELKIKSIKPGLDLEGKKLQILHILLTEHTHSPTPLWEKIGPESKDAPKRKEVPLSKDVPGKDGWYLASDIRNKLKPFSETRIFKELLKDKFIQRSNYIYKDKRGRKLDRFVYRLVVSKENFARLFSHYDITGQASEFVQSEYFKRCREIWAPHVKDFESLIGFESLSGETKLRPIPDSILIAPEAFSAFLMNTGAFQRYVEGLQRLGKYALKDENAGKKAALLILTAGVFLHTSEPYKNNDPVQELREDKLIDALIRFKASIVSYTLRHTSAVNIVPLSEKERIRNQTGGPKRTEPPHGKSR